MAEENIERRVWSFRRFEIYFIFKTSVTVLFYIKPRVRITLEARFFQRLNGASLHRALHVHPSIILF